MGVGPIPPQDAPQTVRVWGRRGGLAPRVVVEPTTATADRPARVSIKGLGRVPLFKLLFGGVEFTPSFIGFLAYILVIITMTVPIGDVSMAVAVCGLLLPQKGGFRFPAPARWLAVFGLWCLIGVTSTRFPREVTEQLYEFGKLAIIALVAFNVLRTRKQIFFFLVFFLGCYAFFPARAGIFGFMFYGGGRTAWRGLFGNPNDLAAISLLPLSMCLGLFFSARNALIRLVSLAGVGVLALVVIFTQSRGALIAMLVFAIAALVTTTGKERLRLIYAFVVAALVAVPLMPQSAIDRYKGLLKLGNATPEELRQVDPEGSAEQRFEIWKVARRVISQNPITGVGLGAYSLAHAERAMDGDFLRTARGRRDAHSTFLSVTAETGFVGLVLFCGIFLSAALRAERIRRLARIHSPPDAAQILYLQLGLLAYFVAGIWGSYERISVTYIHTALLWCFSAVVARELAQRGVRVD